MSYNILIPILMLGRQAQVDGRLAEAREKMLMMKNKAAGLMQASAILGRCHIREMLMMKNRRRG